MKRPRTEKSKSKTAPDARLATLDGSPIHLLHRAGQCAADVFQSKMGSNDLTPRQYAVLATVAAHEGLSQTHLVEKTGIDRSTLADIVRRMLKKGLLQRRRTREDARAYAVKLTEEGRRVMESVGPVAMSVDQTVLAMLSEADRPRFIENLQTIITGLSSETKPTGEPSS
ncbi:MAG: MarR family transcriptional regulator [Hyphomicrobiaceae bacterium]|nr:MarR family transcriptional regulator [Hyphomicrobiaceae bacterium]